MSPWHRWGPALAVVVVAVVVLVFVQARDPVREQWEDRVTLPSCGSVVLSQGEVLESDAMAELACLRRGLESGSGAELKVQYPTVEGDPIRAYYRVTPAGTTELYEDSTEDAWGSREWSFSECDAPASILESSC